MPRRGGGGHHDLPEWVTDISTFWITLCIAIFIISALVSFFRRDSRGSRNTSTAYLAVKARKRLIKALHGDDKTADRLIALEHTKAGKIGCGKLEAIERAFIGLRNNRSRVN